MFVLHALLLRHFLTDLGWKLWEFEWKSCEIALIQTKQIRQFDNYFEQFQPKEALLQTSPVERKVIGSYALKVWFLLDA